MWIVRIALSRPYTFIVLALLLLILGPLAIFRTPTDIFPNIGIPVISVVWSYTGLPPDEMANRITGGFERALSTTVNDIEHLESQSLSGVSVVKIFFQPDVNVDLALSQVTAIAQTLLRSLPPGTTPPLVLSYNASTVPVIQLALSSDSLSEQKLNDFANSFIRTQLATVQGAALPFPYGGKTRQIQVDLNQPALLAHGLSAQDVTTAIGNGNLILPAGTQKVGDTEYSVRLNGSPPTVAELNDLPIKTLGGSTLFVRDVAHVRDGFAPQTNIVKVNGTRAVLLSIQKTGKASTLDIISKVKQLIPRIKLSMPPGMTLTTLSDQSLFVKSAITGVVREGVIAAALTALMILLFLGSWRSTVIIAVSIPLSVLASITLLAALGETINIMTLGGLALAVGILVDDATVAVENINSHLEEGKRVEEAILDGAEQIAVPALVSTLCICIVFVPMFFLTGVAKFLFVPLAEAVVFAMLASYVLSRTLIPTLAMYLLKPHATMPEKSSPVPRQTPRHVGGWARQKARDFQQGFERFFERTKGKYHRLLEHALALGGTFILIALGFFLASILFLGPWLGSDFFPAIDGGQIKLHFRAPAGLRVEQTAALNDRIDALIRQTIPPRELESIVDNIGLPSSGINLSYSNSAPIGPADADVLMTLKEEHRPSLLYTRELRQKLNAAFPDVEFSFLPADIVGQILNFGLPAPVDVQVGGHDLAADRAYATALYQKIRAIPGVVDAHLQQTFNYPTLNVTVDRARASQLGLTQKDVATNLLVSLSGSFQTAPTFWVDPQSGVSYPIVTQSPQYRLNTPQDLRTIPLTAAAPPTNGTGFGDNPLGGGAPQILGALGEVSRAATPAVVSHFNAQPVMDVFANVDGRDLGGVGREIDALLKETAKQVPKGGTVEAHGQLQTRAQSFSGLYLGLAFAIVLVYLLIVVNFQSWVDPFIIITALPAALAGIVWLLFLTGTTLSVPALTGAIMCMGVATANSILVVSFARERLAAGDKPYDAALAAGFSRLRPVLMTALAMVIGMVPMALGLGEGGEQNAPLGRAVIGGLLFATVATLFFVPAVFAFIHGRRAAPNQPLPTPRKPAHA